MSTYRIHISRPALFMLPLVILIMFMTSFLMLHPANAAADDNGYSDLEEFPEDKYLEMGPVEDKETPEIPLEVQLFRAVWDGKPMAVAYFIKEQGADPNTLVPLKNNAFRTLLYDATYKNHTGVVVTLLANGANPDAQNSNGKTALHLASQRGQEKIATILLEAGASPDIPAEDGSTPLIYAAFGGRHKIVKVLIEYGADVNVRTSRTERTALHMAAKRGHFQVIELLTAHGASVDIPDEDGDTPLALAAMNGHSKAAAVLLLSGADPDTGRTPPLVLAARNDHAETAHLLVESGANVNAADRDGRTPLMESARRGNPELVSMLVEHEANPLLTDLEGHTSLHYARDGKTAETLLDGGAIPDVTDRYGNTPLFYAARDAGSYTCMGCAEKAEVLVEGKADILARNEAGDTILHAAARGGLGWLAERCLKRGEDINVRNGTGRTPLHYAVAQERPDPEMVALLIRKGADVNATDKDGKTPLDLLLEQSEVNTSMAELVARELLDHGAKSTAFQP